VAVDLLRLWDMPLSDAVQPRPVGPVTGLDEKLLCLYRQLPSRAVGQRMLPLVGPALTGRVQYESVRQLARTGGIALWEREFGQIAESAGL
jgi:hypothetical protein